MVLPYTRVKRRSGVDTSCRMSHFTARCVLAGLELYQHGVARRFILPGEQHAPATSDLEENYLVRRGVGPERITNLPNLNGTLQQLEPLRVCSVKNRSGPLSLYVSRSTLSVCANTCSCWGYTEASGSGANVC